MAAHALSRRSFFGHAVAATAAAILPAAAGIDAGGSPLAGLIERHRMASMAWGAASLAYDADPSNDNADGECAAHDADEAALAALLAYRPITLGEVGERFRYLLGSDGPWSYFVFEHEHIQTLARSMMPLEGEIL